MGRLKLCSATGVVALIAAIKLASAAPVDQAAATINRGVVELETSGAAGTAPEAKSTARCPADSAAIARLSRALSEYEVAGVSVIGVP